MNRVWVAVLVLVALVGAGCGDDSEDPAIGDVEANSTDDSEGPAVGDVIEAESAGGAAPFALEVIVDGLRSPVELAAPPGDDRLFVLERSRGHVRIIQDDQLLPEPFLDLSERLDPTGEGTDNWGERGLLAIAFHPGYAENGRFFIYYATLAGVSELVEYQVSDDPNRADPDSAVVLRRYGPTEEHEHFGGTLTFTPDGVLWFSLGDGQLRRTARDVTQPRGSINRFDVSTPGVAEGAPGNPYLGDHPGIDEIWAKGLRNPWRISIDAETNLLFVGDVGDLDIEEINVQPADLAGLDYGWPVAEGSRCWRLAETCDASGTVAPALEIERDEGVCAIIGGHVYRGAAIPELQGAYLYGDYCGGFIRSFRYVDGAVTDETEWFEGILRITSFGLDSDNEVYVVTLDGVLGKLVPAT